MTKTKQTIELENALDLQSRQKREYGCREITIGFARNGLGNEIVDYMSMDAESVFRCYEIKVSLSDLKSDAKKSWYGDYNYLVVTDELYLKAPSFEDLLPPFVGILSGTDLKNRKHAAKRKISADTRQMLKDSLIRSVFWKMEQLSDSADPQQYRALEKKLVEEQTRFQTYVQDTDRKSWTYDDYERYYRLNHQDPAFSIEQAAKTERSQYQKRRDHAFTWILKDGAYICPACGREALQNNGSPQLSPYCPYCGSDLRSMKA